MDNSWKGRQARLTPEQKKIQLASERKRDKLRQQDPSFRTRKAREQKERRKILRKRNQTYVLNYLLQHPCEDCGESDPIVLEFDHRDRKDKQYCIGQIATSTYGLETIKKEIEKCDVVCRNCHMRRTRKQMGYKSR